MTFLGYIFVPAALLGLFLSPEYLLYLLMLAMPLEAGSIFNSSIGYFDFGIPPFFAVEICIFFRLAFQCLRGESLLPGPDDPARLIARTLLFFCCWGVFSAFIMPRIFAGTVVSSPRPSGGDQVAPLQWSLSNLAQAGYLTLNTTAVLYALKTIRTAQAATRLLNAFYWAVAIVIVVGFAQYFANALGLDFPYELFNNNPGYMQGFDQEIDYVRRINSTFVEPSFAGSFLSAVAAGLLASFLSGRRGLMRALAIFMVAVVLLLTTATTGLATLGAMLLVLLIFFNPFRKQGNKDHSLGRTWVLLGTMLAGAGLMLYFNPDLLQAALEVTVEKLESFSFVQRVLSDLFAMSIFLKTGLLGVGLGSSRSSSLLTTMFSTVGVVGVSLLGIILYRVNKLFPGRSASASLQICFWGFWGLLVAHAIAIPDLNRPALWALGLLLLVHLNVGVIVRVKEKAQARQLLPSGLPKPMSAG